MARLVVPLTVTQINHAKPKEKLYKLSDGRGLALWAIRQAKRHAALSIVELIKSSIP